MPQVALTTAFARIPTLVGTLGTCVYEDHAPWSWRVAAGACTGFAALGLLGFAAALALRIDAAFVLVAIAAIAAIGFLLSRRGVRGSSLAFAGVPFTYPLLADFITALPVAVGASIRSAMLAQNLVLLFQKIGYAGGFDLYRIDHVR
jgi:hypothetical protein